MIISCPRCVQSVHIPDGRGRLNVKCPKCHTAWVYPPEPVEYAAMEFVCGIDGRVFTVNFTRADSLQKFTICGIIAGRPPAAEKPVLSAAQQALIEIAKLRGERIVAPKEAEPVTHDVGAFDLTGYHCPFCQPAAPSSATFARCGTCSRLICEGGISTIWDGRRKLTCLPDCGGGGILSTTHITSYAVSRVSPAKSSMPAIERNARTLASPAG